MPDIDVKSAVGRASDVLRDLYGDTELRDLLLEDVELSGSTWLVTMGFTRPGRGTLLGALGTTASL